MMKAKNVRPFLLFPVLILAACASQNDMTYVQGEVSKLKQDSQSIKTQSAGSYSEITQSREEVARLQGSIEELRHDHNRAVKRLDVEDSLMVRKTDDLEARIAKLEQYLGIESPKSSAVKTLPPADASSGKSAVATPVKAGAEPAGVDLLAEGLAKMKKSDNAGARDSFSAFMTKNPKSPKVADAQFYIAETYFNDKWFEKAVLEYQVVIAKYTKSPKRPAALFKQGLAFEKLGDAVNAKARFKDVVTVYPNSPEAKLARNKLK
jgi:tol-pal system protein YbgF